MMNSIESSSSFSDDNKREKDQMNGIWLCKSIPGLYGPAFMFEEQLTHNQLLASSA